MTFANPPDAAIAAHLRTVKTIAIVGLSADPGRPSHRVAQGLLRYGYEIVPVNPRLTTWQRRAAQPDLDAAVRSVARSRAIDLIDVFRRSEHVAGIVEDAMRLGLKGVWLQQGVIDTAAAGRAHAAGLFVVMDRCLLVERARLG